LIDTHGGSLDPRIEGVLLQMQGKLQRRFPACRDELTVVDVLEEAARRLTRRERRRGAIANLHGYAWVTVRSVMMSRLRRGDARLAGRLVPAGEAAHLLAVRPATWDTVADLERGILLRQLLAALSPEERQVCTLKAAGYSAGEIARAVGRSPGSVDTLFCRAKAKARRLAGPRVVVSPGADATRGGVRPASRTALR
jgi:RNA polymerase sigma factor (sigma-70 family)